MKNIIDPQILASYKKNPPPMNEIVNFLDTNDNISTAKFCTLIGISPQKVYDYKYRNQKKQFSNKHPLAVTPRAASKKANRYNAEEKYALVEGHLMANDQGKTEILRTYGIYQSDIARWKEQVKQSSLEALGKRKVRSNKKSNEQKRIQELKKELREQEKTTAKLSTLLMLQKKTFDMLKRDV